LAAVVFDEPGQERVLPHLASGVISAVNLSEVACKAIGRGAPPEATRLMLERLPLSVVPFDAEQAHLAASIYPATHGRGISLADRICLALGILLGRPVLTADRSWSKLSLSLEIRLVR
jgi:PIN domain nuclease of toxin-antitoxin system